MRPSALRDRGGDGGQPRRQQYGKGDQRSEPTTLLIAPVFDARREHGGHGLRRHAVPLRAAHGPGRKVFVSSRGRLSPTAPSRSRCLSQPVLVEHLDANHLDHAVIRSPGVCGAGGWVKSRIPDPQGQLHSNPGAGQSTGPPA